MLILTRKEDEAIVIGDNIVVQVLQSRAGQIRIGITAPQDVSIHREEVFQKIHGYTPRIDMSQQKDSNVETAS